ncbi:MAG TPA: sodium:solute symporter [Flavobacteriaceae bacterium]|jgi:Na+/proline symporter|nr:MAG: sodium:solute symporter [Flavobacteriales bacterium]HJO70456.1 sodium:solute symporter [Flavobacteriaceae bacterium]|tara:strand:- start:3386 stop:4828 length:1443 start_codon:yes stop_codon:yes gene_type:complete
MLSPEIILITVLSYFAILTLISYITGREDNNKVFFKANKNSNWLIVAFGMVGASLSGVTFISVPGWVEDSQFTYFQVVLGYLVGYLFVASVLLPIYYRIGLTSIYEYLDQRFGQNSYFVGSVFFLISRVLGASFRLFLVAIVLQEFVFDSMKIPFEITVIFSILLIWLYTKRGGIKTIVWTDTIQTTFMILAVILSIIYINKSLDWSITEFLYSSDLKEYNRIFVMDNFLERNFFWKHFIGGAFITICMTGLDQDMMQKNLTCRNIGEAKKNMVLFSFILTFVTFLFILLGALLYIYAYKNNISIPANSDLLFPKIALEGSLGQFVGITFILGLIAAAYSSADSALTSLTTSFCIDILKINKLSPDRQLKIRKQTHIWMSLALIIVVIIYRYVLDRNVIDSLLTVAQYTYGPLLGLFAFGIFTKFKIDDKKVYYVVIINMILIIILGNIDSSSIGGYSIGYELLPINGLLNFIGLYLIRK